MRRPGGATKSDRLFPIGSVNQRQNREGLEYSGVTIRRPMGAPDVPMPIRASLAQQIVSFRVQYSRKLKFLRTYGFAPGNPIHQAFNQRYTVRMTTGVPRPTISGGARSGPLSVSRTPGSAKAGYMGAPKRFPKALPLRVNTYKPPVYGE